MIKLSTVCSRVLIGLTIWVAVISSARAAVTFDLGSVITGDSPASSKKPWIVAEFDSMTGNKVGLTLSAPNLVGNEDVKEWLFNVDPSVTQAQLNKIKIVSITKEGGSFDATKISLIKEVVNGVTRAGFSFDLDLGLPDGSAAKRFTGGDKVLIVLGTTGSGLSLTEGLFDFKDDTGTYYSAAHIRNTTGREGSGWIGTSVVPEPTTLIAGALLLLPFGASTLRVLRNQWAAGMAQK
jgi:hypothetical protein